MFEKEFLIFTVIVAIVIFVRKNFRYYYLAYKIPLSKFDYSLKATWGLLNVDNETIFKHVLGFHPGPLTKTWIGPILVMNIVSPENLKIVFNAKECFDKPSFLANFTMLSKGLLFCNIDIWRSHRKILNPFFGIQQLRNLIPLFNEKTKILVKNLRKEEGKAEFDVFNNMTAASLETFLKVLEFDVDLQNQEDAKRDSFSQNFKTWLTLVVYRLFKIYLHPEFIYLSTSYGKIERKARSKTAISISSQIIENVRQKMSKENNNNSEKDDDNERLKSPMRALLNPENNLPEDELHDEVSTMILAAEDTSALVTSSVLLLLAMHKDIQEKVHEELIRVLGKPSDDLYVDYDHLSELEYLEMVINESMRVIPIVPFVFRMTGEEIRSHEGYIIPAKTLLFVPINDVHKNKNSWGEDADEFKPERFSKENFSKIHPYAFIPFTKGQRMCIGWRYGMMLVKIQLANVLLNYKVDTKLKLSELRFQVAVTMNIIQGHQISIEKRHY